MKSIRIANESQRTHAVRVRGGFERIAPGQEVTIAPSVEIDAAWGAARGLRIGGAVAAEHATAPKAAPKPAPDEKKAPAKSGEGKAEADSRARAAAGRPAGK